MSTKYARLLVPTSFGPAATQAIYNALRLARQHDATLVMLHILARLSAKLATDMEHISAELVTQIVEDCQAEAMRRLESLVPPEMAAQVTCEVVGGEPAVEIVKAAARHQADLLVMGHGRRRGWWELLRPSVAQHVTRHAPCPVLVVAERARYELVNR